MFVRRKRGAEAAAHVEGNVIRGFIQLVTKEGVSGWTEGVYKG